MYPETEWGCLFVCVLFIFVLLVIDIILYQQDAARRDAAESDRARCAAALAQREQDLIRREQAVQHREALAIEKENQLKILRSVRPFLKRM